MDRDRLWAFRRRQALEISELYEQIGYDKYAARIANCATYLRFELGKWQNHVISQKLTQANFCQCRHCPICQGRYCHIKRIKFGKILPKILAEHNKNPWLFLTLPIKPVPLEQAREAIDSLSRGLGLWAKRTSWMGIGYLRATEFVKSSIPGHIYPHLHVLVLAEKDYYEWRYEKEQIQEHWRSVMKLDYDPFTDIRAVRNPQKKLREVLKYQIKPVDFIDDPLWLESLTKQLHGQNRIESAGVIRQHLGASFDGEEQDLIGKWDDPTFRPSGVSIDMRWRDGEYVEVYVDEGRYELQEDEFVSRVFTK